MNTDEFITSANFISRFEPNKFDRLQRHITENLAKYNVGHVIYLRFLGKRIKNMI